MFRIRQINSGQPIESILGMMKTHKGFCQTKDDKAQWSFTMHQVVASVNRKGVYSFYFRGKIYWNGKNTQILYRIYPSVAVMITSLVLILPILSSFANMSLKNLPVMFWLVGVGINALFHIVVRSQMKDCIEKFERFFAGQGDDLREP